VSKGSYEEITDDIGKGRVHPVSHRKLHFQVHLKPEYRGPSGDPGHIDYGTIGAISNLNKSICNGYATWASGLPIHWDIEPASVSENVLIEDVLERARGLKADVLLNTVEANQLWPSLTSLTNALPVMARNWKNLRKVIRTASGAYLAWKFGLSPVLSDMMSVHKYLPTLKTDVQRHANQDSSRFSRVAILRATFPNGIIGGFGTDNQYREGKVLGDPTVRYVLVVKPSTKYHTSFFRTLDVAVRRFASSPASLAWELVPFSFVADWFVDIRGALRKFDTLLGSEPYKVVGFTRSFSYHLSSEHRYEQLSRCPGSTAVLDAWKCCTVEYKNYERSVVSTGDITPRWNPRFGKNQAGISAALISQKLSSLRR
jgi:hypothetical protein